MKERFLDVIKWSLILIVAGVVFYVVYPKYHFQDGGVVRCNTLTGEVEIWNAEAQTFQALEVRYKE